MRDVRPPIQDPDVLDVVGERRGGGVDLVISCMGPLDESDATCDLLERKINSYLRGATHVNFTNVYPAAAHGRVRIFVSSEYPISGRARALIENLARQALARGVEVVVGRPVA